jgi:hypothetical protein
LENLETIQRINGPAPLPVNNRKTIVSSTVGVAVGENKSAKMWCHYYDKNNHNTADCRVIAKANHHKNGHSETKAVPGNQFVKEQLKTKIPNSKKRKTESLLSAEINLTTTSDEDAEYFPFFLV